MEAGTLKAKKNESTHNVRSLLASYLLGTGDQTLHHQVLAAFKREVVH